MTVVTLKVAILAVSQRLRTAMSRKKFPQNRTRALCVIADSHCYPSQPPERENEDFSDPQSLYDRKLISIQL